MLQMRGCGWKGQAMARGSRDGTAAARLSVWVRFGVTREGLRGIGAAPHEIIV